MKKLLLMLIFVPTLLAGQELAFRTATDESSVAYGSHPLIVRTAFNSGTLPAGSSWIGTFEIQCRVWGQQFVDYGLGTGGQATQGGGYNGAQIAYAGIRTKLSIPSDYDDFYFFYDQTVQIQAFDTTYAHDWFYIGGIWTDYGPTHVTSPACLFNSGEYSWWLSGLGGIWWPPHQPWRTQRAQEWLNENMQFNSIFYFNRSTPLDTMAAVLRVDFYLKMGPSDGDLKLSWSPAYISGNTNAQIRAGAPFDGTASGNPEVSLVPTFWTSVLRGSILWMKRIS
jgi:hypothetical protein